MEMKNWAITLGLGAAVGAMAAMMLPRNCSAKRMLRNAADAVEDTVEDAADTVRRKWDMM